MEPVPVNDTVRGEPLALSVMVRLPVRIPPAVGVNVTEMAQFAPAATLEPQVLAWAKSPEAAIELIFSAAVPVLVSVTVWAALVVPWFSEEKVKLDCVSVTAGAVTTGVVPVPVRETDCGEPAALSIATKVPRLVPTAVGVNITETVQLARAARLEPQVFVWAKSPEVAIELIVSAAVPVLVSVTVWAALVVPSVCEAKVRLVGESVTAGALAAPVPVSDTVCDPAALSPTIIVPG